MTRSAVQVAQSIQWQSGRQNREDLRTWLPDDDLRAADNIWDSDIAGDGAELPSDVMGCHGNGLKN